MKVKKNFYQVGEKTTETLMLSRVVGYLCTQPNFKYVLCKKGTVKIQIANLIKPSYCGEKIEEEQCFKSET